MSSLFSLAFSQEIAIGRKCEIRMKAKPDRMILPTRFVGTAPSPGFAGLRKIDGVRVPLYNIGNPSVLFDDALDILAFAQLPLEQLGMQFDPFSKSREVTIEGIYTGMVPKGMVTGERYFFCVCAIGRLLS